MTKMNESVSFTIKPTGAVEDFCKSADPLIRKDVMASPTFDRPNTARIVQELQDSALGRQADRYFQMEVTDDGQPLDLTQARECVVNFLSERGQVNVVIPTMLDRQGIVRCPIPYLDPTEAPWRYQVIVKFPEHSFATPIGDIAVD